MEDENEELNLGEPAVIEEEPISPAVSEEPVDGAQVPVVPEVEVDPYANFQSVEDAVAALKERDDSIKSLSEQNTQKEQYIQTQKSRLGEAQKYQSKYNEVATEFEKAKIALKNLSDDPYADKDVYADAKANFNQAQRNLDEVGLEAGKTNVLTVHPDFNELLETDIPEVLKREGYSDAQVELMKKQWHKDPTFAVAVADKALLLKDNRLLQEQLDQAKLGTNNVVSKIQNAQSVARPAQGNANVNSNSKPVEDMSYAELEAEFQKIPQVA